jgi:hypothetical protein
MIRRIFLDLDDTCNTLAMHVLHYAGCAVESTDYRQYPAQYGYDLPNVANHLLGRPRYTSPTQFWKNVTQPVWAECPTSEIYPWVLLLAARLVGRENVCIATRPTDFPACVAGKLDWIHRHLPTWMHNQYAITACKHLFARPDTLLIDDLEANLDQFRAEGGHGILVPRPWNTLRHHDPFEAIADQVEKLF